MVLGGEEHFMMLCNCATMTLWRQAQTGLSMKTCRDAGRIEWLKGVQRLQCAQRLLGQVCLTYRALSAGQQEQTRV